MIVWHSIEDLRNMVYNRFFYLLLLRVILLFGALLSIVSIFLRPDLLFTQLILFVLILIQVTEITFFVSRTNRELSRFLSSIKDGDFSINFSGKVDNKSFGLLNTSFRQVIETLKELQTEKEAQLHFLNQLVNQIEFGIITFNEKNEIEIINKQAQSFLQIPRVTVWQNIKNPNVSFIEKLIKLPESSNQLIEQRIENQDRFFSVSITEITIRDGKFRIVSFQDIRNEIQQKEIQAWHKLIRILTHEIMNSVTQLVSLNETNLMLLTNENEEAKESRHLNDENVQDLRESILTVKERTEGILKFVKDYRRLTKIPKPEFEKLIDSFLINTVAKFMSGPLTEARVNLKVMSADVELFADGNLIQQVMINLIKNAIEALEATKDPEIVIQARIQNKQLQLEVSDNGHGIPEEKLDRIFVPFYTTKVEGSGVGLSVSRQIMNLHGGHLDVSSSSSGATFMMIFPLITS